MKSALVPLAEGVEEMEAVIIIDVLRRAGWRVVSAAVRPPGKPGSTVKASRGVHLAADTEWKDVHNDEFDALVLPGGAGGTQVLCSDSCVLDEVRRFAKAGRWVAAICAGPLVLQAAGILKGVRATCHPGVRQELRDPLVSDAPVIVDGKIVTSQGPGTAFEFVLTLIRLLDGAAAAQRVREGLVL